MKLPSGDQHAFMHHGGVFRGGVMRATGFGCRRSQIRNVPSIDASTKVVSEEAGCSVWFADVAAGFSVSSACGRPLEVPLSWASAVPFAVGCVSAAAGGSFASSAAGSSGACTGPPMSIISISALASSSACCMPFAMALENSSSSSPNEGRVAERLFSWPSPNNESWSLSPNNESSGDP
jgi:hypothetical protein